MALGRKSALAAMGPRADVARIGLVIKQNGSFQRGRSTRRSRHDAVVAFLRGQAAGVSRVDVAKAFSISESQAHDVLMSLAKKKRVNHTALDRWELIA